MEEVLEKLVKTPCVPQFQERMEDLLREEIDFAKFEVDHLGNVYLNPESAAKGVVFLAHLSEIGFIIEHIDKSGFLRFKETSTVDKRSLLGQRMMIHGDEGDVRGVVGVMPPHLRKREDSKKPIKIEEMFLDVGAYSRDEAVDMGISIGSTLTFEGWLKELPDGRLIGKALDDRLGCFAAIKALKRLASQGIEVSVYLLSQETTFPRDFSPDYAIAVDATLAGPYPLERVKVERHEIPTEIGKGPTLTLREDDVSVSRKVREFLEEAAERAGVNLQVEASSRANVKMVNPMKKNVSSAMLSLPVKFIRTPGEIASMEDLDDTIDVLESFVEVVS